MRIGFISDLHIDLNIHQDFEQIMAEVCKKQQLDYIVFAGDTSSNLFVAQDFYSSLQKLTPTIVRQIPGNHEQYILQNAGYRVINEQLAQDSDDRFRTLLLDEEYGLYKNPIFTKHWAIVGTSGWYDYSFDFRRATPKRLHKLAAQHFVGMTWPEVRYINGNVVDPQRDIRKTNASLRFLERSFREIRNGHDGDTRKICAVTHVVPTKRLCRQSYAPVMRNFINYLGSERYRVLYEKYNVALSISGHTHMRANFTYNNIQYVNVSLGNFFSWKNKENPVQEIINTMYILEDEI